MINEQTPKEEILIVGAGVFGLATALALLDRRAPERTHITIIDSAETLPNPVGSSVDSSRIIRADYASKPYAKLALQAQELWRDTSSSGWGGQGRYSETGFVLTADDGVGSYVTKSIANLHEIASAGFPIDLDKVEPLTDPAAIERAAGYGGATGDFGYANWNSGWADAEKCIEFALRQLRSRHPSRVTIRTGMRVTELLLDASSHECSGVTAVETSTGHHVNLSASLTILATGAWTPSLIDLDGRCVATGQALLYVQLTDAEQEQFRSLPVVMNMSQGLFVIPPRANELKIARHAYGYLNPMKVSRSDCERPGSTRSVSVPRTDVGVPVEGQEHVRSIMRELLPPDIAIRPFTRTRVCWYCDTPQGDFIIDHHPRHKNLFVATGGSGHGFKFLPVIGSKIVDAIDGGLDPEYRDLWRWPSDEQVQQTAKGPELMGCEDGSRQGKRGLILQDELVKHRL